jgi:hypothetical protein
MYRRTICTDLWPVWFIIERSEAPAIAAACPQAVACILGRIEARTLGKFLYDSGNVGAREPCDLQLTVTIDRAEQRSAGDAGLL